MKIFGSGVRTLVFVAGLGGTTRYWETRVTELAQEHRIVLVDLLGSDEAATDVCYKNPGVLQCNPTALARESAESILKAADQVDFFEGLLGNLPPALRQNLDKVAFFVLALPIAKRLADCSGATCG